MTTVTRQLTAAELDPIADVDRRLPGLRAALDGELMGPLLSSALGITGSVGACRAEQSLYLGNSCLIRYALDVGGREVVVTGRLFADRGAAAVLLTDSLEPLARRVPGPLPAGLGSWTGAVPGHPLVLHAFPVDPELPALLEATDPEWMLAVFRGVVPGALNEALNIVGCRIEPVHYGRRHRCVLRYPLDASDPSGRPRPLTAYGKVAVTAEGAMAGPVIDALRARGEVRVPRSLGYLPDQRLALFEGIPGVPRVAQLLRGRLGGAPPMPGSATLEHAVSVCAEVAARLHSSGVSLGPVRRLTDDLDGLRDAVSLIATASGPLADRLDAWLSVVESGAGGDPLPLTLAHGDYSYTQLIFDGDSVGLVDFDTVCQAEPALDLGHFLAYLDFAGRKGGGPDRQRLTNEMRAHFLATYVTERGLGEAEARWLLERTASYELVSLLRLAIHAWQKLKARRLRLTVQALEDRLTGSANPDS